MRNVSRWKNRHPWGQVEVAQRWPCPHSFSFYLGILSQLFLQEPQFSLLEREYGGVCLVGIKGVHAEKKFSTVCHGGGFVPFPCIG